MKSRPKTIDDYFATVNAEQRAALQKLRNAIQAAAPKAVECICYGLPAFRFEGRPLVCFRAASGHCAFHPMSGDIVAAHRADLKAWSTSKGTVRFQPGKRLPAVLVRKLVKARIAEITGVSSAPTRKSPRPSGARR